MTDLRSLLPAFLAQLRGRKERTLGLYTERLSFFLDGWGDRLPAELTRADVNQWHEALVARGLAPATLAGHRQAIKAFLGFCCGAEHPASHLVIGSFISKRRKLPPESAVLAITSVAEEWVQSALPHQVLYGAIFLLCKGSGPRGGEVRKLRLSETLQGLEEPDRYGIFRLPSEGKTGEVTLCLSGPTASAVRCWLRVRPVGARVDRLFVTTIARRTGKDPVSRFRPLGRSGFDAAFVALAAAAGVRPVRSHALRHRLGDMVTKRYSPKVAAMILNHADAATAATAIAYYHHPDQDDVSLAVAMMAGEDGGLNRLFGVGGGDWAR